MLLFFVAHVTKKFILKNYFQKVLSIKKNINKKQKFYLAICLINIENQNFLLFTSVYF